MTISNRREPTFGAHSAPPEAPHHGPHIGPGEAAAHKVRGSGLTRMVSSVQIIGSLLALPLGLASGYSMYKANFAPDTTCQNLRANIVAMLDKNVDASTRRMLVRRDITIFEETCGGFDPDAHAAFKTLLAVPAATVANAAAPKLRSALPATEVARKVETKTEPKTEPKIETKVEAKAEPKTEPKVEAKVEPKLEAKAEPKPEVKPATASIESIEREAAVSDTRWLNAVRQALVTNNPEIAAPAPASEPAMLEAPTQPSVPKPTRPETLAVAKPAAPAAQLQPTWNVPAQVTVPVAAAPVIAAPAAAAPVPSIDVPNHVMPVRDDAPRPPAPITGPTPINGDVAEEGGKSRIGSWIAQIPLVGRVIEPRGN